MLIKVGTSQANLVDIFIVNIGLSQFGTKIPQDN